MKIYVDENMPFAKEFFSSLGEVQSFAGREVKSSDIADADVLLVRSITKVNRALIENCKNLSFVGSATIGFDHIDRDYLNERGIPFYSAPGCNAISVADYVTSAICVLSERYGFDFREKTVGIIGAGNTGSRVAEKLTALGVKHCLHDPLLEEVGDSRAFVSLEKALSADIVSLHVPKTTAGDYPTFHLLNKERLSSFNENQILINACRGEVIDNKALLKFKQAGHGLKLVLDVWENEPNPLSELIDYTEIATAHIAGYSFEGKSRGTEMLYQALCKEKAVKPLVTLASILPKHAISEIKVDSLEFTDVVKLLQLVYDVRRDDAIFRNLLEDKGFDWLRKNYPVRRENSALTIKTNKQEIIELLKPIGFNLVS